MLKKEELQKTPEYWLETIQNELYQLVVDYMERQGINQTELAEKLGVSKGYISQILKGQFNYTLKKLIELSLAMDRVPNLQFQQYEDFTSVENKKNSVTSYLMVYTSNSLVQSTRFHDGFIHNTYPARLSTKKALNERYDNVKHKFVNRSLAKKEIPFNF